MDASVRTAAAAPVVTIGANFEGISVEGGVPDSNGAVGPAHFVELINTGYRIYDKSGAILQDLSSKLVLDEFWSAAGIDSSGAFDPRVLYDHDSGRWFAAAADGQFTPDSRLLLAVSETSDPTEGWQAVAFRADPSGQSWADFTRLGINKDGVFLVGDRFPLESGGFLAPTVVVVLPKADLLQPIPSAAGAAVLTSEEIPFPTQPAVAFHWSGSEPLLGSFFGGGQLKIASVDLPITDPSLNTADRVIDFSSETGSGFAPQRGTTSVLQTFPLGFGASVVYQDGKLFGVEAVSDDDGLSALRWFMIGDPLTAPLVLDSGLIDPPNLAVYDGSIAVNPLGQAVIGFSGSGPDDFPSAYAAAGTLVGDDLEFGDPILLKAGVAPFQGTGGEGALRWGDYSATTYDPIDPAHFWTIQQWASGSEDRPELWSTQITEIVFGAPPAPTRQVWFGGAGRFEDSENWSPPGPPFDTDALVVDAGVVRALDLTLTNPDILLGSAADAPLLVLRDSTLGAPADIRVPPDLRAAIRLVGTVTGEGDVLVGATGLDPGPILPARLDVDVARDTTFTNAPGAVWSAGAGSAIDVEARRLGTLFVNDGEVEAAGGAVRMDVAVAGTGTFEILPGADGTPAGTLEFGRGVGEGQVVNLDAGVLRLADPAGFRGAILGFDAEGAVELPGARVTSADYADGVLTLFRGRRVEASLALIGDYATEQFVVASEEGGASIRVRAPEGGAWPG